VVSVQTETSQHIDWIGATNEGDGVQRKPHDRDATIESIGVTDAQSIDYELPCNPAAMHCVLNTCCQLVGGLAANTYWNPSSSHGPWLEQIYRRWMQHVQSGNCRPSNSENWSRQTQHVRSNQRSVA
jgi:hypothetical protein